MPLSSSFGSPIGQSVSLGSLVGNIFSFGITVAGIIMVFLFIGGGLGMIAGAGSGDAQAAAKGKQAVTWALIGFIVVFTAYWIIRIIEVLSGNNFFTNPSFFGQG
jgi:hypothetical protein